MKTLPKKIERTLTNVLGDFTLTRVITEELNIGVIRYYISGCCEKGYFAAWNEEKYFNSTDVEMFERLDDAWNYINEQF